MLRTNGQPGSVVRLHEPTAQSAEEIINNLFDWVDVQEAEEFREALHTMYTEFFLNADAPTKDERCLVHQTYMGLRQMLNQSISYKLAMLSNEQASTERRAV